jgi:hypothetical protein
MPPDPAPIHLLLLTTLAPADVTRLAALLRTLPTAALADHALVFLAEPLPFTTLHAWLVADGHQLQASRHIAVQDLP